MRRRHLEALRPLCPVCLAGPGRESPLSCTASFVEADEQIRQGVARIKAQMDERTRTLPVVVEVAEAVNSEENQHLLRLRPGMFVTVEIKGREMEQVFVLPRHLVYPGDVVYTVEDNRLKFKSIKVLRTHKDSVVISEGLSEGDLIIKTPLSAASDGMLVRIK